MNCLKRPQYIPVSQTEVILKELPMVEKMKFPGPSPHPSASEFKSRTLEEKALMSVFTTHSSEDCHKWATLGNPEISQSSTKLIKVKGAVVQIEKLVSLRAATFIEKAPKVCMKECNVVCDRNSSFMSLSFVAISTLMTDISNLPNLSSMSLTYLYVSLVYLFI